jgi:hypothetical protein
MAAATHTAAFVRRSSVYATSLSFISFHASYRVEVIEGYVIYMYVSFNRRDYKVSIFNDAMKQK